MLNDHSIGIRHIRETELATYWALANDLQLRGPYLPCMVQSYQQCLNKFKEDGFSSEQFERLLIVDQQDQIIGTIWHFQSVPYFNAREIGYVLFAKDLRNQQIVSRALKLLTDHLFKSKMINRLEIRMDVRNLASERVAIKAGFQKEGVARGANFVQGEHVDMAVYALLRSEWQNLRAS